MHICWRQKLESTPTVLEYFLDVVLMILEKNPLDLVPNQGAPNRLSSHGHKKFYATRATPQTSILHSLCQPKPQISKSFLLHLPSAPWNCNQTHKSMPVKASLFSMKYWEKWSVLLRMESSNVSMEKTWLNGRKLLWGQFVLRQGELEFTSWTEYHLYFNWLFAMSHVEKHIRKGLGKRH